MQYLTVCICIYRHVLWAYDNTFHTKNMLNKLAIIGVLLMSLRESEHTVQIGSYSHYITDTEVVADSETFTRC